MAVVDQFHRCGDLAAGFTRLQCPECGHEKLLAFSCKTRGFCPGCHQRKVKQTAHWIAHELCFNLPHRQFVFTMPRPLRCIFRKCRKLLSVKKMRQLLSWNHSGFNLDAGEKPIDSHDVHGRQRLAEYLLRAPFSLEKIIWKR